MINNNELYHFNSKPDSTKLDPQLTSPEDSDFSFFTKLIYQTIIAICCLILLLTFYHSNLPWLQWISNRMHSAVNAPKWKFLGRLGNTQLFKKQSIPMRVI